MTRVTLQLVRDRLHARSSARITDPAAGQAAVSLILTPAAGELQALFIRRAERSDDPWSGHMGLPGGRRDPGDADLFRTAVRETEEETGILLSRDHLVGEMDDFTPRTPILPNIIISPFVFGLPAVPAINPSAEVAYHVWVPLSDLRKADTMTQVDIRGSRVDVPAFVLGRDVIWGLTERILRPFIELLP